MQTGDNYYWESTSGWRLVEICDKPRVVENRLQVRVREIYSGAYHTLYAYALSPVPAPGVLNDIK